MNENTWFEIVKLKWKINKVKWWILEKVKNKDDYHFKKWEFYLRENEKKENLLMIQKNF